jgi:hypothetical protein
VTLFVQNDALGAGAGSLNPTQASVDLGTIANGDTGLGLATAVGNRQQVTYSRTLGGNPPIRLEQLVTTVFTANYGSGPQTVNIVVLPVLANFVLNDGSSILDVGGTALPPQGSGLPGDTLNTTNDCLVIYDTTLHNGDGYCVARDGTGGTLDLPTPSSVVLYHELSHALRTAQHTELALTSTCNPSAPEENAAILDENEMRKQLCDAAGKSPELRDPGNHCGSLCGSGASPTCDCCIIASVSSGSAMSAEVQALRAVRDSFLRSTEVGFVFCQKHYQDYYAFSPQVCTMMARRPELRPLVLEGFVRPLMIALRLLQAYALGGLSDTRLGRLLAEEQPDRGQAAYTIATLERARAFSQGEIATGDTVAEELVRLLRERAWPSVHVCWAIVEPVRIYGEALRTYVAGGRPADVGRFLRHAFTAWAVEMPLDPVWASLSARQFERELQIYETRMLRSARAKSRFRRRLMESFGHVTAVCTVLGRTQATAGGVP